MVLSGGDELEHEEQGRIWECDKVIEVAIIGIEYDR